MSKSITQLEAVIRKLEEQITYLKKYVNLLKDSFDLLADNHLISGKFPKKMQAQFHNYVNDGADLNNQIEALEAQLSLLQSAKEEKEEYVPYFGWCDVNGCKGEACSGGMAWKETGYWTVCSKHASSDRNGDPQPKMKQSAIKREKGRDKITGYLSK